MVLPVPDAPAILLRGFAGWLWAVIECPYCKGVHWHGAYGDPLRASLGHRGAHCGAIAVDTSAGYNLVEASNDDPRAVALRARLVRQQGKQAPR